MARTLPPLAALSLPAFLATAACTTLTSGPPLTALDAASLTAVGPSRKGGEVRFHLDLLDDQGRPVVGLSPSNVTVLVDKASQSEGLSVTRVADSTERCAFVLLSSNYRGLETAFAVQQDGLVEFIDGLRPGDVAAVFSYAAGVRTVASFTGRKPDLELAIRRAPQPEQAGNAFADALVTAIEAFGSVPGAAPDHRVVVMLTDGLDRQLMLDQGMVSRLQDEVVPKMRAAGVELHVLGYTEGFDEGLRVLELALGRVGGSYRRIQREELPEVPALFRALRRRIHGRWIVRFKAPHLDPTRDHLVQVRIAVDERVVELPDVTWRAP